MVKTFRKLGKGKVKFPKKFDWPREPSVILECGGSNIIIEKGVTFGSGVYVSTHSHQYSKSNWRELKKIKTSTPTVFKRYSFIGINSIILYKCKYIGKHSVIGAGSVVIKNVPDYEIWAGNPAKKIGDVERKKI